MTPEEELIKIEEIKTDLESQDEKAFTSGITKAEMLIMFNQIIDTLKKDISDKNLKAIEMEKNEILKAQQEANSALHQLREEKKNKHYFRKQEETKDLHEQLAALERKIDKEIDDEYREAIIIAEAMVTAANTAADNQRLALNQFEWHPIGTIMEKWKLGRYSSISKVTARGIVALYDKSMDLKAASRYDTVNVGDIIVIHLKKDGTPGKRYDKIHKRWQEDKYFDYNWKPAKK